MVIIREAARGEPAEVLARVVERAPDPLVAGEAAQAEAKEESRMADLQR